MESESENDKTAIKIEDKDVLIIDPKLLKDESVIIRCVILNDNTNLSSKNLYLNINDILQFIEYKHGMEYIRRHNIPIIYTNFDKSPRRGMISPKTLERFIKEIKYFDTNNRSKVEILESLNYSRSILLNRNSNSTQYTKKSKVEVIPNTEDKGKKSKNKKSKDNSDKTLKLLNDRWKSLSPKKRNAIINLISEE
jgi:hypothetical protein